MCFNLIEANIIGGQLGPPEVGLFPTTHSRATQPALMVGPSWPRPQRPMDETAQGQISKSAWRKKKKERNENHPFSKARL